MRIWKSFWKEEDGMATVEIVLIIAALVACAIIFGTKLKEFTSKASNEVFNSN